MPHPGTLTAPRLVLLPPHPPALPHPHALQHSSPGLRDCMRRLRPGTAVDNPSMEGKMCICGIAWGSSLTGTAGQSTVLNRMPLHELGVCMCRYLYTGIER